MTTDSQSPVGSELAAGAAAEQTADEESVYPQAFSGGLRSPAADVYLADQSTQLLAAFFETKGLQALKEEDRAEQWYDDWLAYQARHRLYADMLCPAPTPTGRTGFTPLRYARFLEVFAYFSPAHGYSLQVTSLAFLAILIGTNADLKREAMALLEAGKLLAFGVSEQRHGSDLLGNEFCVTGTPAAQWVANGRKYYIGNANAASMIVILAKKADAEGRTSRMPFVLIALRPGQAPGFRNLRKIRTLGIRAAHVGDFEVKDHVLSEKDFIAQGREAWDSVFGAVTLGKFFLGFGSIGICEHAFAEAGAHLQQRILYGKPVLDLPHIRSAVAQAYVRLTMMKLYAYRAIDYLQAARADDRRYLLYCAVQKARVTTEGVRVMALLSECMGAAGFEAQTYFEMALRDIQLLPGLEGSMHINLGLTAQFLSPYFKRWAEVPALPPSLLANGSVPPENPSLLTLRTGAVHAIAFRPFLEAYLGVASLENVRVFARQIKAFYKMIQHESFTRKEVADLQQSQVLGQCLAVIAYGQLVAEQTVALHVPLPVLSVMFGLLVEDLTAAALRLAALPSMDLALKARIRRMVKISNSRAADWEAVFRQVDTAVKPQLA